ncbi:MAG: DUF1552 domain-containing protein [Planctomycetaceae bacterium]|nr:DUF1552 domain-containing protein [Planctomycetaceae bacterium]
MSTRRDFMKTGLVGATTLALAPGNLWASESKTPMRFIFMHKGNGLFPRVMVPPTLSEKEQELEQRKQPLSVDLDKHDLPEWMGALSAHKENLTILQGLSGKMCTTGHHTWCSSLGVFKANERLSSIKWATVDFELARLFPSPFEHVELACFPDSGGNSRGNINGIEKGFSARGPQQPNYAFGSPKVAMQELFKSVSSNKTDQLTYALDREVLEFIARNEGHIASELSGLEKTKVKNYADSIEDIRKRNKKVDAMSDLIRKHAPKMEGKYYSENISTLDRQVGHVEILLSVLISGMTNVVTFTVDELGTHYTGVPGVENENINQHDVGHNKGVGSLNADEVRERIRTHHMSLIDTIVTKLKSVPEAGGTMFDNTMLFYFPENGETHHSKGTEYPFIVLAGNNAKLDISRRYIRLPNYGDQGHKTLGNWYTTILNAYGNPIDHYGALDTGLTHIDQKGPIQQFLQG